LDLFPCFSLLKAYALSKDVQQRENYSLYAPPDCKYFITFSKKIPINGGLNIIFQ